MDTRGKRTTSPRTIRQWVEERGGYPAVLKTARGEEPAGTLRIVLAEEVAAEDVERLDWNDFFARFDAQGLALVYQEATTEGKESGVAELVRREEPKATGAGDGASRAAKAG